MKVTEIKITSNSIENIPILVEIIKQHKEKPAVTANAFNLGDDVFIFRSDRRMPLNLSEIMQ